MMEQTHTGKCHSHTVFITAFDNKVVANRTTGFSNIFNTAALSSFYVIAEGKESVRTESNTVFGSKISLYLIISKRFGFCGKILLPVTVSANVFFVSVNITINNVVSFGSAYIRLEGQG